MATQESFGMRHLAGNPSSFPDGAATRAQHTVPHRHQGEDDKGKAGPACFRHARGSGHPSFVASVWTPACACLCGQVGVTALLGPRKAFHRIHASPYAYPLPLVVLGLIRMRHDMPCYHTLSRPRSRKGAGSGDPARADQVRTCRQETIHQPYEDSAARAGEPTCEF